MQPGNRVLDVGCGTATHAKEYSRRVIGGENDKNGHVTCIDVSQDILNVAKERNIIHGLDNVSYERQDIYDTHPSYQSRTFDVVKEDRVLQHLRRPKEAICEMLRVCKPGGLIVCGQPDFRSFQIDHYNGGTTPDHTDNHNTLTTKVLNGVIPTLTSHPNIGLSLPSLLYDGGCNDIEYQAIPIPLIGLENLEKVVPVTYMAYLSYTNGAISKDEMNLWLSYLRSRGDDLFGVLNMYICRGRKPTIGDEGENSTTTVPSIGTRMLTDSKTRNVLKYDVRARFASPKRDNLQTITDIINDAYAISDTGITLTSTRVELRHVIDMVKRNEIIVAVDDTTSGGSDADGTDAADSNILGCLQVVLKTSGNSEKKSDQAKQQDGWPVDDELVNDKIADFSCFAVKRFNDTVRRSGIGAALLYKAEAYARSMGCKKMQLAILCPASDPEPEYKVWLQNYYSSKHDYQHQKTLYLRLDKDQETGEVIYDELHDMHEPLHQLVPCKAIIMDKVL